MIRRVEETQRTRRSTIRRSTHADIQAVHAWLVEEEGRGVHGNFFCNWLVIESAHKDGKLLVYIDGNCSMPVGFQLGGLVQPGILQVRNDYRGKGIGRKLVERCVRLANKRNECLLYIQCKPSSSIPFWERMGFTLLPGSGGKNYAYRILYRQHVLPVEGCKVDVVIRFFPNERKFQAATNPCLSVSPAAKLLPSGTVHLGERVLFHQALYPEAQDMVMEINVNGTCLFRDKARCEEAQLIGVARCENGFYIDRIQTSYAIHARHP